MTLKDTLRPPEEKPRYHHGALHDALLGAAEAELAETGLEAFSLRRVAKRAGVSHAAPAHHFGDAGGLLTALAAEGFRQFTATMTAQEALAAPDPRARMIAAGLGYIGFAAQRPALFRLIFSSDRPDGAAPELRCAARRRVGVRPARAVRRRVHRRRAVFVRWRGAAVQAGRAGGRPAV